MTENNDAARAVLAEFTQKKGDYVTAWKDTYDRCRKHEEFAIMGRQMDDGEMRRLRMPNGFRFPNLLKKYVNQQANKTLQQKFRAVVSPNGGGSDVPKARQREAVLRGIQLPWGAVYNAARRGQLAAGIHYSKIVVDYASQRGFEKSIRYEDVSDTYNVFPDPFVATPTFADMRDFLIREEVARELWKEKTGTDFGPSANKTRTVWYYWKKRGVTRDREYLMKDGTEKLGAELGKDAETGEPDLTHVMMMGDGVTPFARDVSVYDWEWHMIEDDGAAVFRSGEWKGCHPPLVACTGERVVETNGNKTQTYYIPLTADAEEPQVMYTLLEFIIKQRLARSPYSKWKVAYQSLNVKQTQELRKSSIIGDQDLVWNAFDEKGNALPEPKEVEPHVLDAILIELQQVQEKKIEAILGIPVAVFGEKTNETSGRAIEARRAEGDISSYHYTFHFLEYVRQMGMATLEAFPHYYTTVQQVAFMDKDDKAEMMTINAPGGLSFDPMERYSMVVEVQPDSDTDREAEANSLMAMAENQFLGPLILRPKGAAALIVKAQKGRYAQELGEMLEAEGNDPEKAKMAEEMARLKDEAARTAAELERMKSDRAIEVMKERNRHAEKMQEMGITVADNADKNEIAAYKAETEREKADGIPQTPESILE